jgi:Glycosyl transferase family 11
VASGREHAEERNVIVVKLRGGLGNQMFQYALGRALALKHNTKLKLDSSAYGDPNSVPGAPRRYELDCFRLDASFATVLDIGPAPKPGSHWRSRAARTIRALRGIEVIKEWGYPFQPEILDAPDNTYLVGYWQSEKYFKAAESVIRKDFSFRPPLRGRNEELANVIRATDSVSVHFRRGDYVSHPWASKVLGVLPVSYYFQALQEIAARREPHVFVFSDDPEWCRHNIAFPYETTYIDANPADKGFEDMRLMTLCKHHVIANSSFSWWGAWLSPYADKTVYGPGRWALDPGADTSDVVPSDWVKLRLDSEESTSRPADLT